MSDTRSGDKERDLYAELERAWGKTNLADFHSVQVFLLCFDALWPQIQAARSSGTALVAQGPCETTQTPRFQIKDCACGTYEGNLGPCLTWWEGGQVGRCVYCDHGLDCHVKLSKLLAPGASSARTPPVDLKLALRYLQAVEDIAFEIAPPNQYTPRLVEMVAQLRHIIYTACSAIPPRVEEKP